MQTTEPLVKADNLSVKFNVGSTGFWGQEAKWLSAVDNVSLHLDPGEVLGLVGESGSGKTTTGRAILRRVPIASGTVTFKGQDITHVKGEKLRNLRRNMQAVFQDPYDSLNPNQSVLEIIAEPLLVHGLIKNIKEARPEVKEFLDLVGMPTDAVDRYPHAFSGGQRQRIGIARALALKPEFIVADEPVSALDVSIQAQIVNLMQDLRSELNLTYLFIAHDLSVVRHISDRIAIMYAGQLVETSDRTSVYDRPSHPYTQALLSAVPIPDPVVESQRKRLKVVGEVPNLIDPPEGCRFSSRCPYVRDRCLAEAPELREIAPKHEVACHFVEDIPALSLAAMGS
ncbi:MAG: ABC transporter ATP-binding protein [Armatimonadetes bacterium]|nr:MAG: ABC transporter ATP-binding protein [Armatimonadota bacterium]